MATVIETLRARFAPPAFVIDNERPSDVVARENLLDLAMGADRRKKSSEILRRNRVPADGLAFVARDHDGHVIGTVRLWSIEAGMGSDGNPVSALLLGPLAVDRAHEGKGIGSALVREALAQARKLGHGAVVLVGDAPYYERFGFSAGLAHTLVMPGPFARNRLLAIELKQGWLSGATGMIVAAGRRYARQGEKRAA